MEVTKMTNFILKHAAFDWYQTTVFGYDGKPEVVLQMLAEEYPDSDLIQKPALNGYTTCYYIQCCDGSPQVAVMWGGNDGINIKFTGKNAINAQEILQKKGLEHYPTRIDSAIDYTLPGFYDRAAKILCNLAQKQRLKIEQKGDWIRGEARTLYIGSPTSEFRICMYEKGYEMGLVGNPDFPNAPHWTRLEFRLRPKNRVNKMITARWSAAVLPTAGIFGDCISAVFGKTEPVGKFGSVYTITDNQRAIYSMVKQYKNALSSLAGECGSWEKMGARLGEMIENSEA